MNTVSPTPHLAARRVGDDDRQRVIDVLADQHAKGVLPQDEFEERLGAAITAQTTGELGRLVVDLPLRSGSPDEGNIPRRRFRLPHVSRRAWRAAGVSLVLAAVSYTFAISFAVATDVAWAAGTAGLVLGVLVGRFSARWRGRT